MHGCDVENRTKVRTPEGWIGRIDVSRRERRLINEGKCNLVSVVSDGGLVSHHLVGNLEEIVEEPPASVCEMCGRSD